MRAIALVACLVVFITMLPMAALASETYTPPPEEMKAPRVTAQSLYATKCSKCHPLSRPDQARKTIAGWTETVSRMRTKDPSWISQEEFEKICSYLSGRDLFEAKCLKCHEATKSEVQKTVIQWQNTVDRMQQKDLKWISNDEKKYIVFYLIDTRLLEIE